MSQKKSDKRKLTFSASYYQAWPEEVYAKLSETIERYARRYKYVCYGVTTDYKTQYDQHIRHDDISWQKMHVRYRTEDIRTIKKLITQCEQDEKYIDNNIHFPETLFDKHNTYYVYVLVGKRKKGKNANNTQHYTFAELNAGLGGFHTALSRLGCTCILASEGNKDLRELYSINHEVKGEVYNDLSELTVIPHYDILCASITDEDASLETICHLIAKQGKDKPRYLLFETIANIKALDEGHTWNVMQEKLTDLGYDVKSDILSPHQFGIPQHRQRTYIVGIRSDLRDFSRFAFPKPNNNPCDIHTIIRKDNDTSGDNIQPLTIKQYKVLKMWQDFIDGCHEHNVPIPRFPIWAMEFGTTNSYQSLPRWKRYAISKNRQFYDDNKEWLDTWLENIRPFESTYQKLEWHVSDDNSFKLRDNIIQILASGIRVKSPTFSPSLAGSLLPIIPWVELPPQIIKKHTSEELEGYALTEEDVSYGRYLTIHEAANLQGLGTLSFGNLSATRAIESLSNSVNAQMIEKIAKELLCT